MNIRDRIKELRRVPGRELRANPLNFRKHPTQQRSALAGILQQIGIASALIARETPEGLELIDGHLRAEDYGDAEWPVLVLDVTEAEAKLLLATLDPLAGLAEQDSEALKSLVAGMTAADATLAKAALDADTLRKLFEPLQGQTDPDDVPEAPSEPVTQPGDIWQLGAHRLICGDCTDAGTVKRLMGKDRAAMISTDPPYGVDLEGAKYCPTAKAWEGIANDNRTGGDLAAWMEAVWRLWIGYCRPDSSFYAWAAAMEEGAAAAAAAAMRSAGIHVQSQIIWVKNSLSLGQADYQWKHENCWYGFLKGNKHRWYGGRAQTTVWEIAKIANSEYLHPMQKPTALYEIPMNNHTLPGDVVAEPFAGSGSQLIAAEQLGRRCYAIEISPAYCDIIVARWEKFTGKKATRTE